MWQTTLTRKVAPQALKVRESPKTAAILWIAPFSQIRHNYVHSHEHLHTNMPVKSHQPLRHNCNYPIWRFKCGFLSKYSLVWLNNSHEPWFLCGKLETDLAFSGVLLIQSAAVPEAFRKLLSMLLALQEFPRHHSLFQILARGQNDMYQGMLEAGLLISFPPAVLYIKGKLHSKIISFDMIEFFP